MSRRPKKKTFSQVNQDTATEYSESASSTEAIPQRTDSTEKAETAPTFKRPIYAIVDDDVAEIPKTSPPPPYPSFNDKKDSVIVHDSLDNVSAIGGPLYVARLREQADADHEELAAVSALVDTLKVQIDQQSSTLRVFDEKIASEASKHEHYGRLLDSKFDDLESTLQDRADRKISTALQESELTLSDKFAFIEKRFEELRDTISAGNCASAEQELKSNSSKSSKVSLDDVIWQNGSSALDDYLEESKLALRLDKELVAIKTQISDNQKDVTQFCKQINTKLSDRFDSIDKLFGGFRPEIDALQTQVTELAQEVKKVAPSQTDFRQSDIQSPAIKESGLIEVLIVSASASHPVRLNVLPAFFSGLKQPSPSAVASIMSKQNSNIMNEANRSWILKAVTADSNDLVFVSEKMNASKSSWLAKASKSVGRGVVVLTGLGAAVLVYLNAAEI